MDRKSYKVLLILFCCFFSRCGLHSQDLHFTNYSFSPLYFNPAETGSFLGTIRVGAIARDQFRSFFGEAYQSQIVFIDSPQAFGLGDNDWVGIGFAFYNDKVGDIGLKNSGFILSAAYHKAFDKKYKDVLSFGMQYGQIARNSVDSDKALFEDGLLSGNESLDQPMLDAFKDNYTDINIGVLYKHKYSKKNSYEIGLSIYHLLSPDFQGLDRANTIPRRLNFHTGFYQVLNKKFAIEPKLNFSRSSLFNRQISIAYNTNIQFRLHYKLRSNQRNAIVDIKDEENSLMFGLGYRVADAMQFLLGARYREWEIGFAFDLTVSEASEYNSSRGAYELGLKKLINIYKKPEVDRAILCPNF